MEDANKQLAGEGWFHLPIHKTSCFEPTLQYFFRELRSQMKIMAFAHPLRIKIASANKISFVKTIKDFLERDVITFYALLGVNGVNCYVHSSSEKNQNNTPCSPHKIL